MSDRDRPKSPPSPPAPPAQKPATASPVAPTSGRVARDERGQAIWEWSVKTGMFDRNADTSRIRKLTEGPDELRIVEDPPPPQDPHANDAAPRGARPAAGGRTVPGAPAAAAARGGTSAGRTAPPATNARAAAPAAKPTEIPDRSGGFNPYERAQVERPAPKSRETAGGDPYSRGPAKRPEDVSFNPYERGPKK